MAETKWTAGPWVYRPREFDDWGWVRSASMDTVAQAKAGRHLSSSEEAEHRRNGTDPYEANARLIAAAPDLYEALQKARDLFEDDETISSVIDAALRRARGEE